MKMKKIISLFSALAVVSTMCVAFATSTFAAVAADSKPEIQGYVESVDSSNYAIMKFKLINNEELNYSINRGAVTSNGINAIQVKVKLNSEVFDVSETYMTAGFTGVSTSGDNTDTLTLVFKPTSVDSYMINVPEYLFQVDALLKSGYNFDNIPDNAVSFEQTLIEYTSYAGVKPADGKTTYTIYASDDVPTKDYAFTLKFEGTAAPVVDKEFDTADTTVNSTNAVEGKYNGKILKHIATVLENSALSKKISIKNESTGETRVSDRTIAQTLGGIGVDGATVTGTIAIGVLTDTDAVFTFSLVD